MRVIENLYKKVKETHLLENIQTSNTRLYVSLQSQRVSLLRGFLLSMAIKGTACFLGQASLYGLWRLRFATSSNSSHIRRDPDWPLSFQARPHPLFVRLRTLRSSAFASKHLKFVAHQALLVAAVADWALAKKFH